MGQISAFRWPPDVIQGIGMVLALAIFFAALRFSPIAGTHGAEHQVVHAIERGEPLLPSVVRRMPRVHPRCGTNYAAGAMIFFSLLEAPFLPSEIRPLVAVVAALVGWRPLGTFLQRFVTTKPANDRQIAGAIRTAEALMKQYQSDPFPRANFLRRLWNSGIFHVMAGTLAALALLQGLSMLTGWPLGL